MSESNDVPGAGKANPSDDNSLAEARGSLTEWRRGAKQRRQWRQQIRIDDDTAVTPRCGVDNTA
jgi:hypothetical protein